MPTHSHGYNFDNLDEASVKHKAAETLFEHPTKGLDDYDTDNELQTWSLLHMPKRSSSKTLMTCQKKTQIETIKQKLPALNDSISVQGTESVYHETRPIVGIPGL